MQDNKSIEKAKQLVDDLYYFRDNYFIINEIKSDSNINKEADVEKKLKEVINELEKIKEDCEREDRATYYMLLGRAINVTNNYDSQAFDYLTRSIKLNPQLIQAWNQLGECYWKKNDLQSALNCFEGALKHNKNDKIALRNASMVLRQVGNTLEEKRTNLLKSLEKAKEAVKSDVNDGISWYILGNAYLTLFFTSTNFDMSVLRLCKSAYNKAKLDHIANTQADFLFNYANVLHYEENFEEALSLLNKAAIISPDWHDPSSLITS